MEPKNIQSENAEQPLSSTGLLAVDSPHWARGGTGVTNFQREEVELYKTAIQQFGDPQLVLSRLPMQPHCHSDYSLHDLSEGRDLTPFWNVFDRVKASAANADVLAPAGEKTPTKPTNE